MEQAVLAAKSSRSAREFVAAVEGWAEATPTLATSILGLAARLQRGEVLSQMARGGSALAPALVLVGFLNRLRFPAVLEDEMGLALRIAAALRTDAADAAGSKDGLLREDARSFAAIVKAAVPYAGLPSCALALVLETRFAADARAVALDLLEELCRLPEAGALKLEALIVWDLDAQRHSVPPKWILSGLCDVLRRPGELARSLAQLSEDARWAALEVGPRVLPLRDAESFWQQAWDWADDSAKRKLLGGFDELLFRARGEAARRLSPPTLEHLMIEMARSHGFDPGSKKHPPHADPEGFRKVRLAYEALSIPGALPLAYITAPLDPAAELAAWRERWEAAVQQAGERARQAAEDDQAVESFVATASRLPLGEALGRFAGEGG